MSFALIRTITNPLTSTLMHLIINLATLLKNRLRGSGCLVYATDMKVRLEIANSYFYPDLVVTCDSRDNRSFSEDFIRYPRLIVEVLPLLL